jgi:ligand-binding sensor domain-containing protein
MKICNLFLIVSLLGIFTQPFQTSPKSMQTASPAISTTAQAWRTFTKVTSIHSLAIQGEYLWAGTDGGVVRWNTTDGSYVKYTTADGLANNSIEPITSDARGNVWAGAGGVSKFDGTTWTTYTTADGLVSNGVTAIASDAAGNLWFGTWDRGVSKFDGTNWTTYSTIDGLVSNNIQAMASDLDGNLWFGTDNGVSKFDGTNWTTYTIDNGLAANYIFAIAGDPVGNMWFGTGFGVSKFNGTSWTTYTAADGLPIGAVDAITSDPDGNLWIGTNINGVGKFDGATWTTYTTANGLAFYWFTSIAADSAGNIWFGTYSKGVSKFDGATWTTYTTADGLVNNTNSVVATDKSGNQWFGAGWGNAMGQGETGWGVSKFDGAAWTSYTTANGLVSNRVNAITSDADGNLWFGTYEGVSELHFMRSLSANYDDGAPGSFFNLTSDHFPANQKVPVSVNGAQLGNVSISSHGTFTFTISTSNADVGGYIVKVGESPSVQARLRLDAQELIRPKEGDYNVIDIPSGIALTPYFYLPALRR